MINKLMVGVSALALSAGAAHAQVSRPSSATGASVTEASVTDRNSRPFAEATYAGSLSASPGTKGTAGTTGTAGGSTASAGAAGANPTPVKPAAPGVDLDPVKEGTQGNDPASASNARLTADERKAIGDSVDTASKIIGDGNAGLLVSAAGNKAAIDQDGSNNTAAVDQDKGSSGFAAVSQQSSGAADATGGNDVRINQADKGAVVVKAGPPEETTSANRAFVQQVTGSTANPSNKADINQNHHLDEGSGGSNNAVVMQGGFLNADNQQTTSTNATASITQDGAGHDAVIAQAAIVGDGTIASDNEATIRQTKGTNNRAAIQQEENTDTSAGSRVSQEGSSNQGYVLQSNANALSDADGSQEVDVTQVGDGNFAAARQDSGAQTISVEQKGGFNTAVAAQTVDAFSADSTIKQNSDNNYAETHQSAASASSLIKQTAIAEAVVAPALPAPTVGNAATVNQSTSSARAEVTQRGDNNQTFVFQSGDAGTAQDFANSIVDQSAGTTDTPVRITDNLASVTQTKLGNSSIKQGSDDNSAIVFQSGNAGSTVIQGDGAGAGDANEAYVTQLSAASSYMSQTGDNNDARVFQAGEGSFTSATPPVFEAAVSSIDQAGNGNIVGVTQTSASGSAESVIAQSTDSNLALVFQGADAESEIMQKTGNGNEAWVTQLAAGAVSSIVQSGGLNAATVYQNTAASNSLISQNGNGNVAFVSQ